MLIRHAFEELKSNPALGRSEALRRSMLYLSQMKDKDEVYAHPSQWAPFVLVGEGAAH